MKIASLIKKNLYSSKPHEAVSVLANVFETKHTRHALLSYVKEVFVSEATKNDLTHTNRYTTFLIAEILNDLGFNVDVASWNEEPEIDDKYDLVIGLGKVLDKALKERTGKHPSVIWFGTGCNPLYSNHATLARLKEFKLRTGLMLLESTRYIKEDWPLQHEFSDCIILHGQTFARSTYSHENVLCIHAPVFIHHQITRSEQDWKDAKNNFLWFGNGGLIHKGLDLVIEAFSGTEKNLHVCGNAEGEAAFFDYYKKKLTESHNIFYHGFVDVKSIQFADILKKCAFVVFPSASEGNSPSVITCMGNGGLIPIVSPSSDVEAGGKEIIIKSLTVDGVKEAVNFASTLTIAQLQIRSAEIYKQTRVINSFDYFKNDMKEKLKIALRNIDSAKYENM